MRKPLIAAAAGLLAAASLTACSGSASVSTNSNLDTAKLESTLPAELQTQLDLQEAPTVTCPDNIEQKQGNNFTCTAELNGETADIAVTQTDDSGNVDWKLVQPSPSN